MQKQSLHKELTAWKMNAKYHLAEVQVQIV